MQHVIAAEPLHGVDPATPREAILARTPINPAEKQGGGIADKDRPAVITAAELDHVVACHGLNRVSSGSGVDTVVAGAGANDILPVTDRYSIRTAASHDHVAPRGADETVGFVRAHDGRRQMPACGRTPIDVEPVPCPDPSDQGACPIRAGDLLPEVAVDASNGNLYAVWMDARFDGGLFLTDHDNIAFTESTDGGQTWSTPIKVNKTPTDEPNFDQQVFTPSVDVDGNGTVTVTYYDFRNNTSSPATLDTDYFAVSCESASENCASPASWEEERITAASFDIRMAPFARGYFLGDYMGLDNDGTDFASMFGQAFAQNDASQYFSRLEP